MAGFQENLKQGKEFLEKNELSLAAKSLAQCINLEPKQEEPYYLIAEIYRKLERFDDMIFFLDSAYKTCDKNKDLSLGYLGTAYFQKGDIKKAKYYINLALELNPHLERFNGILGNIENESGNQIKAIEYYTKELSINNNRAIVHYDLAISYKNIGETTKAIEHLESAYRLDPDSQDTMANFLSFMLYAPSASKKRIKELAEEYYKKHLLVKLNDQRRIFDFSKRKKTKDQKLRIGFVTGDFWSHPTSHFLAGVLKEINHDKFESIAFDTTGEINSRGKSSEHIKATVNEWHDLSSMESFQAAQYIYDLNIDVLMDLSGHTRNNRLDIFILKPAPIQVSWLAYPSTTGIHEIDYVLVDDNTIKEGEELFYTEQPLRLDCSQTPFSINIDNKIEAPPYKKNGYITFGCLNNFSKVNQEVLDLWSQVLNKSPNSKLYIRTFVLDDIELQEKIRCYFESKGITRDRILLEGFDTRENFINNYNKIDIALDVFPYSGATTSVETIMMGVPLISLEGDSWHARVSAGLMRAVGLGDLIAQDKEEYIEKALELSKNKQRIDDCRNKLRGLALNSSCNARNFTREFEKALQEISLG